jgi:hypothetical protein
LRVRVLVEKQVDPLAGGQLALLVNFLDLFRPAAKLELILEAQIFVR